MSTTQNGIEARAATVGGKAYVVVERGEELLGCFSVRKDGRLKRLVRFPGILNRGRMRKLRATVDEIAAKRGAPPGWAERVVQALSR